MKWVKDITTKMLPKPFLNPNEREKFKNHDNHKDSYIK